MIFVPSLMRKRDLALMLLRSYARAVPPLELFILIALPIVIPLVAYLVTKLIP